MGAVNNMNGMEKDIIANMAEGVMTVDTDGRILSVNPACERILERTGEDLVGNRFAACFFMYEENDDFNQAVIDAICEKNQVRDCFVPYYTGKRKIMLHLITSLLVKDDEPVGLILVFTDVSELFELRDAMEAARKIEALNRQLALRNELLSKTFGRYLSDEIVSSLMDTEHGLDLGGRKQRLTVMMSDLRGFTSISEQMPADRLLTMLNHYLGVMTEIIQKHKGTIIEFIGDGIMAIFGAPQPLGDHAAQAVAAAIEMQSRMAEINAWNSTRGFPELQMGIGVNTGDMVVGNIGSEKRTKYGVTGSEVNLCGRIENYTVGGQVLISETVREEIALGHLNQPEILEIVESFRVVTKGKAEPLLIHRVEGIGGDYGFVFHAAPDVTKILAEPVTVNCALIEGKDVSEERFELRILELGKTGAVVETVEAGILARFDNLLIEFGGQLYAKVMGRANSAGVFGSSAADAGELKMTGEHADAAAGSERWRIHFTAFPAGFKETYERTAEGQR